MVKYLLMMGALCQSPQFTRFDKMATVAIDAKAKEIALGFRNSDGQVRRDRTRAALHEFIKSRMNIGVPFQPAESALIENVVDKSARPYDVGLLQQSPVLGWHDVVINGVVVKVYGQLYYPWTK